jgi:hypothetical protein
MEKIQRASTQLEQPQDGVLFIVYEYVRRRTLLCVMKEDPTVHVRKDMTLKYYASTIVRLFKR